jgi:hypothetical protein
MDTEGKFWGTARSGAVGFSIGTKGYIGMGGKMIFGNIDPVSNGMDA